LLIILLTFSLILVDQRIFDMRFTILSAIAALAAVTPIAAFNIDQWDVLAGKALVNQVMYHYTRPDSPKTCTPLTATVRREW
jgi:tyrosinase